MISSALCQSDDGNGPLVKVGASMNEPDLRAQQLTASTSSPTPFTVVYSRFTYDVTTAEQKAHEALSYCRVNARREFFRCSVLEACKAVDRVVGGPSQIVEEPPTPLANLFATFPDNGEPRELTDVERRKVAAALATA